mmetsp:Transcript_62178/g.140628  ORF Transcript_62178/g.140628 Transcript_62178/m.140628 type:complete len:478 (+) Transcript_62178:189-1622(+)
MSTHSVSSRFTATVLILLLTASLGRVQQREESIRAVAALARLAQDGSNWASPRDDRDLLELFTLREVCSSHRTGARQISPDTKKLCRRMKNNSTQQKISPRSLAAATVSPSCALNNQEGHAKPTARLPERALFERLDTTSLGLPEKMSSMAHFLERIASFGVGRPGRKFKQSDGSSSLVFIGDSVMENAMFSLMCDAQRSAPTVAFAQAVEPKRFIEQTSRRGPRVVPIAITERGPPLVLTVVQSTIPIQRSDGPWFLTAIFCKLACNSDSRLTETAAVLKIIKGLAGPRGVVVGNFGLHLHRTSSFNGNRRQTDNGCRGATVQPWIQALDQYSRVGGMSFWMDTMAQHFGPAGDYDMRTPMTSNNTCSVLNPNLRRLPTDEHLIQTLKTEEARVELRESRAFSELGERGSDFKNTFTRALCPPGCNVKFLPFYDITASRERLKSGLISPEKLDCTHIAYTPLLYEPLVMSLNMLLN